MENVCTVTYINGMNGWTFFFVIYCAQVYEAHNEPAFKALNDYSYYFYVYYYLAYINFN